MIFDSNCINDKGGNGQIKRQQSFDTPQQKTKAGSPGSNGDSGRKF
jgi:hypothetical protein